MCEAMKGTDPHRRGRYTQQRLDASAHLGGGLVGESHREYAVGRLAVDLAYPGDAMRQNPGFAATGAGQNQQRAGLGANRLTLALIQGIDYVGYVHLRQEN